MSTLTLASHNPEIDKLVAQTTWRAWQPVMEGQAWRWTAEHHDEFEIFQPGGRSARLLHNNGFTVTSSFLEPQGPFETLEDAQRVLCLLASFKVEQSEDLGIGLTYEVVSAEFGRSAPCATLAEAQAKLAEAQATLAEAQVTLAVMARLAGLTVSE